MIELETTAEERADLARRARNADNNDWHPHGAILLPLLRDIDRLAESLILARSTNPTPPAGMRERVIEEAVAKLKSMNTQLSRHGFLYVFVDDAVAAIRALAQPEGGRT